MPDRSLQLPQTYMLLAHGSETGRHCGSYLDLALAGAGVFELVERGVLTDSGEDKRPFAWGDPTPTGDRFLDRLIERLKEKGVDRRGRTIVQDLARPKGLRQALRDDLSGRGIVAQETEKVFLFFDRIRLIERDPQVRRDIVRGLKAAVEGGSDLNERDEILLALIVMTGMQKRVLGKEFVRTHRTRLKTLAKKGGRSGSATRKAIEAAQAAIIAASSAAVVAGAS